MFRVNKLSYKVVGALALCLCGSSFAPFPEVPPEAEKLLALIAPTILGEGCVEPIVTKALVPAVDPVERLIFAYSSLSSNPLRRPLAGEPEAPIKSAAFDAFTNAPWKVRVPWPSFRAFFETDTNGSVRPELSAVKDATSVTAFSTFGAYELAGQTSIDGRIRVTLPEDDYLRRHYDPSVFITNRLFPADTELLRDSYIVDNSHTLTDVREVLEIRIHYRRPDQTFGTLVVQKTVGEGAKVSMIARRVESYGWWCRLLWQVIEAALSLDAPSSYAADIKTQVAHLRTSNIEPVLIEIAHSHPFDSLLLEFPPYHEGGAVRRHVIDPMLSAEDKRFFSQIIKALGREIPVALSVVNGLSSETASKEYMIIR